MPAPIDRSDPVYRDGRIVSQLSDEEVWALAGLMARLAASLVRRRRDTERAHDDRPAAGE